MLQKKQETLAFFREMEDNIRRKIAVAQNQQDETVASSNFSNLYYSLNSSDGLSYLDSGEAMYRDDGKEGRSRLCSVGSNDGSTGTKSLAGSYDGNLCSSSKKNPNNLDSRWYVIFVHRS
jgi:hypothetical protein